MLKIKINMLEVIFFVLTTAFLVWMFISLSNYEYERDYRFEDKQEYIKCLKEEIKKVRERS